MARELTRQELFDLVWAQPMTKVAAEFGLSDVGLKKICQKHRIPVPGRGYWAKVAAGAAPRKALFHPSRDSAVETIVIRAGVVATLPPEVQAARQLARAQRQPKPKPVPQSPPPAEIDDDRLLRLTKALERAKPDDSGLVAVTDARLMPMTISPAQATRAVDFVQALVRAGEARGHTLVGTDKGLVLKVDGEPVTLAIHEKTDRHRHEPTEKESAALAKWEGDRERRVRRGDYWGGPEKPTIPEWEYHPAGDLVLTIDEGQHWDGLRRRYSDTKRSRLETMIDTILEGMATLVAARKVARAEAERRAAERAEAERRRRDYQRRLTLQNKRLEFLDKHLANFKRAAELDAFVDSYLAHYRQADLPPHCGLLIDWARDYARWLRDRSAPANLEPVLEKHRLMDDEAEISEWVRIE